MNVVDFIDYVQQLHNKAYLDNKQEVVDTLKLVLSALPVGIEEQRT